MAFLRSPSTATPTLFGRLLAPVALLMGSALAATPAAASWGENSWGSLVWGASEPVPLPGLGPVAFFVLVAGLVALGHLVLRPRGRSWLVRLAIAGVVLVPMVAVAGTIVMPHSFANGTIADADEVNENFDTLVLESNAQDTRLADLEALEVLGGLSCASGEIAKWNGSSWGCAPDDDSGPPVLYTAGSGLTLLGSEFSIPTSAVTATHLATNSVGSSEIAASAVGSSEIAGSAVGSSEIASNAVGSSEIANGSIIGKDISSAADLTVDTVSATNLTASGAVEGDSFEFASAKTYHHVVGATEFRRSDTVTQSWVRVETIGSYAYTNDQSADAVYAPLRLPQDANITALTCYYKDNSPHLQLEDFDMTLYAVDFGSSSGFPLAQSINDPPDFADGVTRSFTDSTVGGTGDPVDNSEYRYTLALTWDLASGLGGTESLVQFHGCRVSYQLSEVSSP